MQMRQNQYDGKESAFGPDLRCCTTGIEFDHNSAKNGGNLKCSDPNTEPQQKERGSEIVCITV